MYTQDKTSGPERTLTRVQRRRFLAVARAEYGRGGKTLLAGTLLVTLLALGVVGCSDSPSGGVITPGSGGVVTPLNTITVVGEATVKSAPDEAVLTLTVESDGNDTAAAMNTNSVAVAKVVERVKGEGVDEKSIETANVSLYAIMTYSGTGRPKVAGYHATNTVTVTLTDIQLVGKVISASIEAGANNISGPTWRLSDDAQPVADALTKAAQNARKKAEALAAAMGVDLGSVVMMSENSVQVPLYPIYGDMYAAKDAGAGTVAETPISAGNLDVVANVTVTFAID